MAVKVSEVILPPFWKQCSAAVVQRPAHVTSSSSIPRRSTLHRRHEARICRGRGNTGVPRQPDATMPLSR